MKNFLSASWFKIGLLFIGVAVIWILYAALVVQPREQRELSLQREQTLKAEEQSKQTEITTQREQCIAGAKATLNSNVAIDDEFCSKCDQYSYNVNLENQCLDGCLNLKTKSLDKYKQSEKLCLDRYPLGN